MSVLHCIIIFYIFSWLPFFSEANNNCGNGKKIRFRSRNIFAPIRSEQLIILFNFDAKIITNQERCQDFFEPFK